MYHARQLITILLGILIIAGVAMFALNTLIKPQYSGTAVLKRVQDLNRLETVEYRYEKVIDEGATGTAIHDMLFGDRILLIAQGDVTAGIDLKKLSASDIAVTGDSVTIKLPPAEVFTARLDNENTRVYDRRLGLLTKGDVDLEKKARLEAEGVIRKQACTDEILKKASDNAVTQVTSLLKLLEFKTIEVQTTPASCT